ncbi:MAG: hypothetical protein JWO11_4216, partial [Nocardioides sp.]|nr:hypothetical protein [Nocardioides sp.]
MAAPDDKAGAGDRAAAIELVEAALANGRIIA